MTDWNGCHRSGCYLNKNAILYSDFLPITAPSIEKKGLLMCGQGKKHLEGNILSSLPHTQVLFCDCVHLWLWHSIHSTYLHICLFLINLSICLWYPKIWFAHCRLCMAGPGVLPTLLSVGVQKTAAQHAKQDKAGAPWFSPIFYWAVILLSLISLLWNAEL